MQNSVRVCFVAMALWGAIHANAQSKEPDRIVVIGSASIDAPADRIVINVHLSFSDSADGKSAFQLHKTAEERLGAFLLSRAIPESVVTYTLLNIVTSTYNAWRDKSSIVYTTNQTITIVVSDFKKYPQFILALISEGFANINQQFQSSKGPDAQKQATQMAVQQARVKAELMASAAGRKIKKVSKISDTDETEPAFGRYYLRSTLGDRTSTYFQLSAIPQTVSVDKQVKVVFDLVE